MGRAVRGSRYFSPATAVGSVPTVRRGGCARCARHTGHRLGFAQVFWSPRTPASASADLDRVLRHYARAWNKSHVLLIGDSQGADTMPFMVNRLPPSSRALVGLTALLGISDSALFEFHVANWLGDPGGGLPIAPELSHWTGSSYVCIYGEEDDDSACSKLAGRGGAAVKMAGGHHFGGSYEEIAAEISPALADALACRRLKRADA